MSGTATNPGLCNQCLSIFADGSLDRYINLKDSVENNFNASWRAKQVHHENGASFIQAIRQACRICSKLAASKNIEHLGNSVWYFQVFDGVIFLNFSIWDGSKYFCAPDVSFIARPAHGEENIFELAKGSLQHSNTGNEATGKLCKEWLLECCRSHKACGLRCDPTYYPTRLLYISDNGVRLIVTADEPPHGPYATMSHCWGKKPFLNLTSDNLIQFQQGVDLLALPPNFRDIIRTAARMDINYIWIDSFCIIQAGDQSQADWQREAATMKQVYANALVNLAVAHAKTPYDGCFADRDPTCLDHPLCIQWLPLSSGERSLYQVIENHGSVKYLQLFTRNGLFSRGWVYQERLLCSRMLYFTAQQVWWECSGKGQMLANEEHPAGMPSPRFKQDLYPWALETASSKLRNGQQSSLALWSDIVTQYSQLALTKPDQDKLLALGGISERMQEMRKDKYVAGLFLHDLVSQLTWSAGKEPGHRSADWRAPSWSWMSLNGYIEYPKFVHEATAAVEGLELQPKLDANPFGALQRASLSLRCRLLPATYIPRAGIESFLLERPRIKVSDEEYEFFDDDLAEQPSRAIAVYLVVTQLCGIVGQGEMPSVLLSKEEILSLPNSLEKYQVHRFELDYYGLVLREFEPNRFLRLGAMLLKNQTLHLLHLWKMTTESVVEIL